MKIKKSRSKNKKNSMKWIIEITALAFLISLFFSFFSETLLPNVPVVIGILLLFIVIGLGILFDMIGLAVTTVDERPFHSMSSKGLKEARIAVLLKKNADKVSSFCNDVIGDICGIISGSAGAIIAVSISQSFNLNSFITTLVVMALIAALTIGGKALGKGTAIRRNEQIVHQFSKIISLVYKPKN